MDIEAKGYLLPRSGGNTSYLVKAASKRSFSWPRARNLRKRCIIWERANSLSLG